MHQGMWQGGGYAAVFRDAVHGSVFFKDANNLVALGPGSAGDVLQSGGAGADVSWVAGGGGGETNTMSHAGAGTQIFNAKSDVNFPMRGIAAGSSKVTITLDGSDIDIDVDESNIDHTALANIGSDSHATIDAHIDVFTGAARGEVWFYGAAGLQSLGVGTNGQVLTSGGVGADVSWSSAAGGDSGLDVNYDAVAVITLDAAGNKPVDISGDAFAGNSWFPGLILSNETLATGSPTTHYYPPTLRMLGTYWDTSGLASETIGLEQRLNLSNTAGTLNPSLEWWASINGGAYAEWFTIEDKDAYVSIAPRSGRYTSIGYEVTSHAFNTPDDLVCDRIETNTLSHFDGGFRSYAASQIKIGGSLLFEDAVEVSFGNIGDVKMDWSTADASNHTFVIGLGDTSKSVVFCDAADRNTDWNLSAFSDPTAVFQGNSTTTANRGYIQYADATTEFVIASVTGDVYLNPAGSVKFGTHSAIGAETVTGYITINDSGGTARKLAVVS